MMKIFQKINRHNWILAGNIAVAGCLLIVMAAVMWNQPLLADDWDFYRAITDWQQLRQLIPHPQAYVHFTQLCLAIFGENTSNARIPGVLAALSNLILIPILIQSFWGDEKHTNQIAILAIWLYTLNPMTAQNMMLLDIDNTLLMPALCILIWLWKVTQNHTFGQRIAILGGAFAVTLWVKLPTPVLVMGAFCLYDLLRKEFKRTLAAFLATVAGASIFLITFGVYSAVTGYSFAFLNRTLQKAPTSISSIGGMLTRFPQGLGVFILWLSFPLTILLGVITVQTLVRLLSRRLEDQDLLVIYIVGTAIFYMLVLPPAWGYPKYHTPLLPLVVILVARFLVHKLEGSSRRMLVAVMVLALGVFLYKLVVIDDLFYPLYAVTFETDTGDLAIRLARGFEVMLGLIVPFAIALSIGYGLAWRWKQRITLVIVILLGALAISDMTSTTIVQVRADYSTRYRYTYHYDDLYQTLDDLRQANVSYILGVMDVLYNEGWSGEQIYYKYLCATCDPQTLIDAIYAQRVDALIWTTKEDNRAPNVSRDPALLQVLDRCYMRKTHGVFIVYLRKSNSLCP